MTCFFRFRSKKERCLSYARPSLLARQLIGLVLISLSGCEPDPFTIDLANYSIHFPVTIGELRKRYPDGHTDAYCKFIDSSKTVKVEWWFSNGLHDTLSQSHSVVMFLRHKDAQFDSVKNALEQRYRQRLEPLVFTRSKGDFSRLKPIYVCHINRDVFLVLTKSDSYRSEPTSLRIAIGYNLTAKQEEAFALLGGPVYDDKL